VAGQRAGILPEPTGRQRTPSKCSLPSAMRPFRQVAPLAGRLRTEVRARRHYDRRYRSVQRGRSA
jgi:hypothetical protein